MDLFNLYFVMRYTNKVFHCRLVSSEKIKDELYTGHKINSKFVNEICLCSAKIEQENVQRPSKTFPLKYLFWYSRPISR